MHGYVRIGCIEGDRQEVRYRKAQLVHEIALAMHGSVEGLSLDDIRTRYSDAPLSRSTAERLRDAVGQLYPMEHTNPGEVPKRWRIRGSNPRALASITAQDLADLETATAALKREHLQAQAKNIEKLASKLKAILRPGELSRIAPDLEALAEAEGMALRAGPRPSIDPAIIATLRHAILSCKKVELHYQARGTGAVSRQIVCPYGFLHGSRHYLVAFSMNPEVRDYRSYSLAGIKRVDTLTQSFNRTQDFSLHNFTRRSFGVFQEEPFDVVWRFSAQVAADARTFLFHPGQRFELQKDGSLLVHFTAGGALEMAWHLYTWGKHVKVIKPKNFWRRVRRIQNS